MQRTVHVVLLLSFMAFLTGCADKNKGMATDSSQALVEYKDPYYSAYDSAPQETVQTAETGSATPAAETDYAASATDVPVIVAQGDIVPVRSSHHVVVKGDTLYSLARAYYGNQAKWRDIYSANRGFLTTPDRIYVGQELAIP